jgi:hypothetical protein
MRAARLRWLFCALLMIGLTAPTLAEKISTPARRGRGVTDRQLCPRKCGEYTLEHGASSLDICLLIESRRSGTPIVVRKSPRDMAHPLDLAFGLSKLASKPNFDLDFATHPLDYGIGCKRPDSKRSNVS